jgi:hypothetical protein
MASNRKTLDRFSPATEPQCSKAEAHSGHPNGRKALTFITAIDLGDPQPIAG